MKSSILVAIKDAASSRAIIDYLCNLPLRSRRLEMTLLHVFRRPAAASQLVTPENMQEESARLHQIMQAAKEKLVHNGLAAETVHITMLQHSFPTVAEGIIAQCSKKHYHLVVIGRKKKSKSEEFVLGDVSIKLIRALEDTSVLVVKS